MKKQASIKSSLTALFGPLIAAATLTLQSCDADGDDSFYPDYYYANAIVTVKHDAAGTVFLQLDEGTTLLPTNLNPSIFDGKEVRALLNYKPSEAPHEGYSKSVKVVWIDSIRTKGMVLPENLPATLADDPVEIAAGWATCLEDGYLTLQLCTYWGTPARQHQVELVAATDPQKPYELTLRHDAKGDLSGQWNSSLVAFRLDMLPEDTPDGQEITLKWKSYSGTKSATFRYQNGSVASSQTEAGISLHGLGQVE